MATIFTQRLLPSIASWTFHSLEASASASSSVHLKPKFAKIIHSWQQYPITASSLPLPVPHWPVPVSFQFSYRCRFVKIIHSWQRYPLLPANASWSFHSAEASASANFSSYQFSLKLATMSIWNLDLSKYPLLTKISTPGGKHVLNISNYPLMAIKYPLTHILLDFEQTHDSELPVLLLRTGNKILELSKLLTRSNNVQSLSPSNFWNQHWQIFFLAKKLSTNMSTTTTTLSVWQ